MAYPSPQNEEGRLQAVQSYQVYGTGPERDFDDLVQLASTLTGCPLAAVTIVADTSKWMKARLGIPPEYTEVPRNISCCTHAICQGDVLVVPDLSADERFSDFPYVADEPHLRFYAGAPLIDPEGFALGTLCVLDLEPRELDFAATEALRRLARQVVAQLDLRRKLAQLQDAERMLVAQKKKADELILNILPASIAEELEVAGHVEPRHHPSVTTLFADFAGFTRFAETLAPRRLVDDLDAFFSAFDEIVARRGLEKLKTIGDAYMCVSGLTRDNPHHAADACLCALEILHHVERANARRLAMQLEPWRLRIGLHTGPVMAGVVGKTKFTYDVWGDAVNVAAKMEQAGEPGRVNLSESTWRQVETYFEGTARGQLAVKNKRAVSMFFLDRLKPQYSADEAGHIASEALFENRQTAGLRWAAPRG